jgi:hypothetical protein
MQIVTEELPDGVGHRTECFVLIIKAPEFRQAGAACLKRRETFVFARKARSKAFLRGPTRDAVWQISDMIASPVLFLMTSLRAALHSLKQAQGTPLARCTRHFRIRFFG